MCSFPTLVGNLPFKNMFYGSMVWLAYSLKNWSVMDSINYQVDEIWNHRQMILAHVCSGIVIRITDVGRPVLILDRTILCRGDLGLHRMWNVSWTLIRFQPCFLTVDMTSSYCLDFSIMMKPI